MGQFRGRAAFAALFGLLFGACGDYVAGLDTVAPAPDTDAAASDQPTAPDGFEVDAPPVAGLPVLGEPTFVVPSATLPGDVHLQQAANNLDATRHDDLVFLAFRTAETHFASPDTELYVLSSPDQQVWTYEARFDRGTDLREPRLLSFNGRLFLYFAVLGQSPIQFEPQGMMVSERTVDQNDNVVWTEPEWVYEPGFIGWRTKVLDNRPYLLGYVGGEGLYGGAEQPPEVHWLTSADGRNWGPVAPNQPVVLRNGCSETDFVFRDDGGIIAVGRNEYGDDVGFGSRICRAEPDWLGRWICVHDPKKYDSPLLFRHGPAIYLIGRRNVTETGHYDLERRDLSLERQRLEYDLDYWQRPKRTALWQVDPDTLTVSFIADLPSRGDTSFAALLPEGPDAYTIFNYTSPLDGPDLSWHDGQFGPTLIYRLPLTFE